MTLAARLAATVHAPEAAAWLAAQTPSSFGPAFAAASRRLGRAAISADEAAAITNAGLRWPVTGVDTCGRAALILGAMGPLAADAHAGFIRDLFRRGELGERQAVLRVLAALPSPAQHLDVAIDGFRSNAASVLEAIAVDNDYPAQHFPAPAFHQLVIKALFVGIPLARIAGLASRVDDELVRMTAAFASERRAAGRPVPDDVALILR